MNKKWWIVIGVIVFLFVVGIYFYNQYIALGPTSLQNTPQGPLQPSYGSDDIPWDYYIQVLEYMINNPHIHPLIDQSTQPSLSPHL